MKLRLGVFPGLAFFLILSVALSMAALGEEPPATAITITKVTEEPVDAPVLTPSKPARNNPRAEKWIEVEVTYDVNAAPKAFLDEATFKVWIEMRDKADEKDEGTPVMLTGEATYVNIGDGHDNYAVFYVHPDTVARYGGSRDLKNYNVHVAAYVGGTLVSSLDKNTKEEDKEYYTKYKAIGGLVYNKDQSPWASFSNNNRYPAIKLQK